VPGERLGACAQRGLQGQGFGRRAVTRASSTDSPHLFERIERSDCSELCGAIDTRAPQRSRRAFGADRRTGVPAPTRPRLGDLHGVRKARIQNPQRIASRRPFNTPPFASPPDAATAVNREALRQQMLLRALWRDDSSLQGWVRAPARASASQSLKVYRSNAGALAERALSSAYPTVAALIGAESFAALARHFWHAHPPVRGDVGEWGAHLPAFIANSEQLAGERYLADCARLDWAVHAATRAADANAAWPPALGALATTDPSQLRLQLKPGMAVIASRWPIVAVWQAHHGDEKFDNVRAAFAAGLAQSALVWRDDGFAVHVEAAGGSPDAAFTAAAIDGQSLAAALDAAGADFSFEHWLERALRSRWLMALVSGDPT
jgi:hypothetical protein